MYVCILKRKGKKNCGQLYHPVVINTNLNFFKYIIPMYANLASSSSLELLALCLFVPLPE